MGGRTLALLALAVLPLTGCHGGGSKTAATTTGPPATSPPAPPTTGASPAGPASSGAATGPGASEAGTSAEARPHRDVPLARLAGQLVVVRMPAAGATPALLAAVRRGAVGGVILFADSIDSPAAVAAQIRALQAAARAGGAPPLLVAVDQEGGTVRRFGTLAPEASATELAALGDQAIEVVGRESGHALARVGVTVNLAPVLDVAHPGSFLDSRAFGSTPAIVAAHGSAFVRGLQAGGVAATGKHFPGLGGATANTDGGAIVVQLPRAVLVRDLLPYRRAIADGLELVMASSAEYPALDRSGVPATLSRPILTGLLRGDLDFGGAVITDDLTSPVFAHLRNVAPRAVHAGVDLLLYGHGTTTGAAGLQSLLAAVRAGTLDRRELEDAYARVLALKGAT